MGRSKSILSYTDVKAVLERVIVDGKGLKLTFKGEKEAKTWVSRAHHFRQAHRDENEKLHPAVADPLHGKSEFDPLYITREGNVVRIMEIRLEAEIEEIE